MENDRQGVLYLIAVCIFMQLLFCAFCAWIIMGEIGTKYVAGGPFLVAYFCFILSLWIVPLLLIFEAIVYVKSIKIDGLRSRHLSPLAIGIVAEGGVWLAAIWACR